VILPEYVGYWQRKFRGLTREQIAVVHFPANCKCDECESGRYVQQRCLEGDATPLRILVWCGHVDHERGAPCNTPTDRAVYREIAVPKILATLTSN
jgi:hypothetical protein